MYSLARCPGGHWGHRHAKALPGHRPRHPGRSPEADARHGGRCAPRAAGYHDHQHPRLLGAAGGLVVIPKIMFFWQSFFVGVLLFVPLKRKLVRNSEAEDFFGAIWRKSELDGSRSWKEIWWFLAVLWRYRCWHAEHWLKRGPQFESQTVPCDHFLKVEMHP